MTLRSALRPLARFLSDSSWRRNQTEILVDWILLRARHPGLRKSTASADKAPVLIVSLTDWVTQVKIEGMLSKALQAQEHPVMVLTQRGNGNAKRYFRAFGVETIVNLEDLLDAQPQTELPAPLREQLSGKITFEKLFAITHNGIRVGRHVLSTLVRKVKQGSLNFSDPEVVKNLPSLFSLSIRTSNAMDAFLKKTKPCCVLFLERGYTPYAECFEQAVLQDLNVIQYIHSQRNEALVLKRYNRENQDIHCFSLGKKTWGKVQSLPWNGEKATSMRNEILQSYEKGNWFNRQQLLTPKKIFSRDEIMSRLGLDPKKKLAVVFSHVLWDATFFYGQNLFPDYEQWLIATVRAACKNNKVNWIIKLHPDYVWKMKREKDTARVRDLVAIDSGVGQLPPHVVVLAPDTDISTHSFFSAMDYCITVRGTIGIEAPCFGIPVLTAGTGRYSGLGFTNDSSSQEEYLGKLAAIQDLPRLSPEQTEAACRHADALFNLRPLTFTSFVTVTQDLKHMGHALDHNVRIFASSPTAVREAKDLAAFSDWVLRSADEDFLSL